MYMMLQYKMTAYSKMKASQIISVFCQGKYSRYDIIRDIQLFRIRTECIFYAGVEMQGIHRPRGMTSPGPQNHEKWRFYTHKIWVIKIITKKMKVVGSHRWRYIQGLGINLDLEHQQTRPAEPWTSPWLDPSNSACKNHILKLSRGVILQYQPGVVEETQV